jgi:hypothetical protein
MRLRLSPLLVLVLAGGALAAPAAAPAASSLNVKVDIGRPGDRYVLKGPVALAPGEVARTVVVIDGPVTVARGATITEDLVVVDGPVRISGTVRGRVVTLGGRARVTPSGVVGDGIRWGSDPPVLAPGATVRGDTSRVSVNLNAAAPFVPALAWWLAVTVSTFLLGLLALWLAPRAADRTWTLMHEGGWGPAIGIGFVIAIGLPVVAFVALVTLVGIPFGIGLLLALLPLGALGYVTGAWVLGRALVGPPRSRALAFLAGWAVLRALALVPIFGAFVWAVAAMFGLGALAWALWRSRAPDVPAGGPEAPLAPAI